MSDRADGDFHVDGTAAALASRRQRLLAGEWTWLRQIHSGVVVDVPDPGAAAGGEADGSVTTSVGAVLAVQTADCAPVVLVGDGGIAVAHAGWRGIVEGVIPTAVQELRRRTGGPVRALLGPVIRPHAYEFGEAELVRVEAVAGPTVRAATSEGAPALDMAAAVAAVLAGSGVEEFVDLGFDTADEVYFSHRVRGDAGRQVTAVVLEPVS